VSKDGAGQPADAEPSLRDSISSAFDASESVDAAPSTPAPETGDVGTSSPAADDKATGTTSAEAAPAEGTTAEGAREPAAAVPAKPAGDAPRTPPGFPGGDAAWNALPAESRNWVKQREVQVERHIRANAEAAKFGGSMWNAIKPYEPLIRAQGAHPAQVVAGALNMHYTLAQGTPQQKAAVIQGLAKQYGVTTDEGFGQSEATQPNAEVQQLRQMLGGVIHHLRGQEENHVRQQYAAAEQFIGQFASGSQRDYMNDSRVTNLMADLIERGTAQSLEDAYDKAVYAFPDIRAVLLEKDAAQRANAARTAAGAAPPRGGAPVAASMAPSNESIRATLERNWDGQASRRVA